MTEPVPYKNCGWTPLNLAPSYSCPRTGIAYIDEELERFTRLPSALRLFHYTSAAGVHGILESGSLRASDMRFMNDEQELRLAFDLIQSAVDRIATGKTHEEMLAGLDRSRATGICVACLSAAGDLLSQWRAYTPEEGGYTIGYDLDSLGSNLAEHSFSLFPCIYEPDDQRLIAEQLVEKYSESWNEIGSSQSQWAFIVDVLKIAPFIKHEAFREEEEWRIVSEPVWSASHAAILLKFRMTPSLLVPYLNVDFDISHVREIVIGPHPHAGLAEDALRSFFLTQSVQHVALRHSTVPYRVL